MGRQPKKPEATVEVEDKSNLKSRFFEEGEKKPTKQKNSNIKSKKSKVPRGSNHKRLIVLWSNVTVPDIVQLDTSLELLRATPAPEVCEEEDGMDILKKSLLESKSIETVRKENFFSEEVTEEEREIIAQRVALQQRQFAAYEYREKVRKSIKIRKMFDYINDEEISELLNECEQDEDEVIYRLTQPGYLYDIRKTIALKYAKEEDSYVPLMTADQRVAYQQLLKKRSETLKKTTNDQAKKQYRMCGRLGLDEALEQIQNNQVDPEKAFEGWSQARIKAYQMIDQNPNSYYYRFNAPGEIQRRGQWDEDEKVMFHARLKELGANGQWGIFSMKVPGRVGYQCSNYYRLLIETQQIVDPNYVLDERGKAHYLFDKKNADGKIQKTFRTHSKHSSEYNENIAPPVASSSKAKKKEPIATTSKKRKLKEKIEPVEKHMAEESTSKPSTSGSNKKPLARAGSRRRRRGKYQDSDSDSDNSIYDDDFSGNFRTRSSRDSNQNESDASKRRSKRQKRPKVESDETGTNDNSLSLWQSLDQQSTDTENDPTCPLPGFIDPITLEQVVKPAISKYGHVMGYDSWTRCLNNWEGQRNICPLTKKPLTKRDLVVLTFDNLDEYKDKIVNI